MVSVSWLPLNLLGSWQAAAWVGAFLLGQLVAGKKHLSYAPWFSIPGSSIQCTLLEWLMSKPSPSSASHLAHSNPPNSC